jgi:hypothetical protein
MNSLTLFTLLFSFRLLRDNTPRFTTIGLRAAADTAQRTAGAFSSV